MLGIILSAAITKTAMVEYFENFQMLFKRRWAILLLLLITGCGSSPEDVASQYLKAIIAGDLPTAQKKLCIVGGFDIFEIKEIRKPGKKIDSEKISWEITNVSQSEISGVPIAMVDFRYTFPQSRQYKDLGSKVFAGGRGRILLTDEPMKLKEFEGTMVWLGLKADLFEPENFTTKRPCVFFVRRL